MAHLLAVEWARPLTEEEVGVFPFAVRPKLGRGGDGLEQGRRRGFFLRAEDFFNHLRMQARTDARIVREASELRGVQVEDDTGGPGGPPSSRR